MSAHNGQVILNLRLERPCRSPGSSEAQGSFLPHSPALHCSSSHGRWKETWPTQNNRRKGPTRTSCPHLLRRWVAGQDSLVKGLSKKQDERIHSYLTCFPNKVGSHWSVPITLQGQHSLRNWILARGPPQLLHSFKQSYSILHVAKGHNFR